MVYVNSNVWFWTDPATYKPRTARAQAGTAWVEATATPTALVFHPDRGWATKQCQGPGTVFVPWKSDRRNPSPSGCSYVYKKTTAHNERRHAQIGIRWAITWRTENNEQGVLPDMETTTPLTFGVGELHNLVVK